MSTADFQPARLVARLQGILLPNTGRDGSVANFSFNSIFEPRCQNNSHRRRLRVRCCAPGRAHRRAPSVRRPHHSRNPVQRAAFRCSRTPAFLSPFRHLRGLGHITSPRPTVPVEVVDFILPFATIFRMASIAANWKISVRGRCLSGTRRRDWRIIFCGGRAAAGV